MQLQSPTTTLRKRQQSPSSPGRSTCVDYSTTGSSPMLKLIQKFQSLLLVSMIAISSSSSRLLVSNNNLLFAEALDSPTAPYTTSGTISPNNNPDESSSQQSLSTLKNNEQLGEAETEAAEAAAAETTTVVDQRAETIIQTINTSEEDAIDLRENIQTYEDDTNNNNREEEDALSSQYDYPNYEPKAQKQKQRQKQRQIRKQQQQQQQQQSSSSDQHHMLRDATLTDPNIEQEVLQQEKTDNVVNSVAEKQQPLQPQPQPQPQPHSTQAENEAYMHWCEKVLGIQSVVEIKEFEYIDHLQIHWEEKNDHSDDTNLFGEEGFDWLKQYTTTTATTATTGGEDDTPISSQEEGQTQAELVLPTKLVRGIAAKHDIAIGDIVISIPLYSLLSVPTTIDHDPVLSRILGPTARQKMDWTNDNDTAAEYEIALLVIAVLYHRSLGSDSPLSHYIEILMGTPTMIDSFPFLWSEKELQSKTVGDVGVQTLARGIRQDLYEMYDKVMGSLVMERPEIFAPPEGYRINNSPLGGGDAGGSSSAVEWSYSYEKFQWAFALVISRHHYLPIQDFDEEDYNKATTTPASSAARPNEIPAVKEADNTPSQNQETLSTVSEVAPPANQPTDSWVDLAKNEERVTEDDYLVQETGTTGDDDDDITSTMQSVPMRHSFLAPLADLINFGPPCLTGSYNAEEHVFELIATCPFTRGQEVTFFYSSDCSDVIIANFGFLHPLVPPCDVPPSQEDWERKSEEWDEKTKMWEKELWEVYQKQDLLKDELAVLESQLVSCECEDGERKDDAKQQQQVYSMPTASSSAGAEVNNNKKHQHHHHSLRQDSNFGVRGRVNEPDYATKEMMEELG